MTRRRGRPRAERRPRADRGTPELQRKRRAGLTAEALDLCLERGIISPEQHWCGVHLRWLYTLRFGAPGVRAVDPRFFGGTEIRCEDAEWRGAREAEYLIAVQAMGVRLAPVVLAIAVHGERPAALSDARARRFGVANLALAEKIDAEIAQIREGFEHLERLWCKGRGKNAAAPIKN